MQALIDLAIAETNTAYDLSGVEIELNLVYASYIAYNETTIQNARNELNRQTDGIMDEAHQWRADYAAGQLFHAAVFI